jgi:hypothetical protein
MADGETIIAGIVVPSTSPLFLSVVGLHVLVGLACTIAGLVAMLSKKGRGRHSSFGTIYYRCLLAVFLTAAGLSVARWSEDYHLFILGALSFAAVHVGRSALRTLWPWPQLHVIGMGASYILLLTAFYVDNGKNLPLWRELPRIAFWLLPGAIGAPIILYVLRRHPVIKSFRRAG